MRKERDIIVKVIQKDNINYRRLAQFFANKYSEKGEDVPKEKS